MDTKVYITGTHRYTLDMLKGYIEDPNGKYRLVDKKEVLAVQEPETQQLTLEELNVRNQEIEARLKRLEGIVIDPRPLKK